MTGQRPPRILCIEDNPVNWRLVQRLLTQAGCEMHWADEGLKGFDKALEIMPDMVLLDINLPGLSGFEIATKFRAHPELKHLRIVALTAKTLKADRETAIVAGCDGFIPKPIDPFTFVGQVTRYLEGQQDQIEQGREGAVLRNFNAQMLEHLESQLREVQDANRKLMEAQTALKLRNRNLSGLLALSQSILVEHDPRVLMGRILQEVVTEVNPNQIYAYRLHTSGGYWEGIRLRDGIPGEAPTISHDSMFAQRVKASLPLGIAQDGEKLRVSRVYDEGIALKLWEMNEEPCLILLKDRQEDLELWGFWALARTKGAPWTASELEALTLLASIALTNVENAELIVSLNESSRALASSYEQMEGAYQDLQRAKEDLMRRDRQVLLEDLFHKIARRLQTPVASINSQVRLLDELLTESAPVREAVGERGPRALAEIGEAVLTIGGLLRALLRRTRKTESEVPEWVDLQDLLVQEMELLHAECGIPAEVKVLMDLQAGEAMLFGVYGDFAKMLQHVVMHTLDSPQPPGWIQISTWREQDCFHMAVRDDAGVIPPSELSHAFEPFSSLHQPVVIGVRVPAPGLTVVRQMLVSYHGDTEIRNEEEGTTVHLWFPLR
jgi:CheY-like chemotaxis protein